ncbi:hypothetical protein Nisw_02670 [Candidatus Nitrosopumilus sp. SW]|uniref:DUF6659 family protein n=1 Tax=Candidatus Nitrosopumilus sp. SW TaxID=2508726 RepID=UPI001153F69F|nr:DUF6659 family protein [Candidatus Nitrosopumilus sp. SW]QDI88511.1 hypothetical protein Nisw_02670 [Candidatus Nitrosopumilus sp. SW]
MDFEKLYLDILNLDSSIRYAAIQNNTGVKIAGGFRSEITPILSDDELQMMHYYASQRWQTRKNIEHKIGPAKYALAEYNKIKRITFPIDDKHLLMITTEIDADHTSIIKKILELINN